MRFVTFVLLLVTVLAGHVYFGSVSALFPGVSAAAGTDEIVVRMAIASRF